MASCAYCNTTILFGGKGYDGHKFCSDKCLQQGVLTNLASQIPQQDVDKYITKVHQGACPKCKGEGPVDVHVSHRVYSLLVYTSWASRPAICCKSCGKKRKVNDAAFSLFLGWWGFPWGLLVTPWQIGKNALGLMQSTDATTPSPALEKMLRFDLAAQVMEKQQRENYRV